MTCVVLKKLDDNCFETITSKITPKSINFDKTFSSFYKHVNEPYVYKGNFDIISCERKNTKTKLVMKLHETFEKIEIH